MALALVVWAPVSSTPQPSATPARALLDRIGAFNGTDHALVARGDPVARVLSTERREVAIVGAVRVRAPRERILARYRDVSGLARTEMVLQVGVFSPKPVADDLLPLAFEPYDLNAVRECRPGDCAVRLPSIALPRFQREVNYRAADWPQQVARTWRGVLADYAAAFRAQGESALAEYQNKEEPLRMQEEFGLLYRESAPVNQVVPEFVKAVREYPRTALSGVSEQMYWSKEDFGIRPVVSITHQTFYEPPGSKQGFIATRQIYATHYFDAGLGWTLILDNGDGSLTVVVVNRVRTRSLQSIFRAMVRSTVQSKSREAMEKLLRSLKVHAER